MTEVRAACVDAEAFRAASRQYPAVAEVFLRMLVRRGRRATEELTDVVFIDGPGRLARRILQLTQWFGTQEDAALRVNHNLTQKELGELTGSSREMVIKWIREFADRGCIKVEGRSMLIYNQQRLAGRAR